jgi:TetR/AcrR family transcriptional regulator, transcriptional repressor for nem operon
MDATVVSEMADSATAKKAGKRERLVESARSLIHEQGVHRTTLADVAERADVPLGNVYYYFKTKDDLVGAVVDCYQDGVEDLIRAFERHRTPQARLKALVQHWVEMREAIVLHGCPMGTLCAELEKADGGPERDPAAVLGRAVDWAEDQFRQLRARDARDLAVSLVAGVQGAALLANAFRDPAILTRQARRLERLIDEVA